MHFPTYLAILQRGFQFLIMAKPSQDRKPRSDDKGKHFIIRSPIKRPTSLPPFTRPQQKWREKFKIMFDEHLANIDEENFDQILQTFNKTRNENTELSPTPPNSPKFSFPPTPPPEPSFPLNDKSEYDEMSLLLKRMDLCQAKFNAAINEDVPNLIVISDEEDIYVSDSDDAIDLACNCNGISKADCVCTL